MRVNLFFILLQKDRPYVHTDVGESSIYLGILFILTGIAIKHFRMYGVISGYNTLPKEKKAKVDVKKLATLIRNVLVFMGAILIVCNYLSDYYQKEIINQIGFFATLPIGFIVLAVLVSRIIYKSD